jgi:catechol 2,3-dioxygenase-like lactoylglutathione lyase family enzyme
MADSPAMRGVYLFVRDLPRSVAFYRNLGLEIESVSEALARAVLPGGALLELGTAELTRSYDPHWEPPSGAGLSQINFELGSAEAVDATWAALTAAGFKGHLPPCDPPWQARFAIVHDPDGNPVGLHAPRALGRDRLREAATHGGPAGSRGTA